MRRPLSLAALGSLLAAGAATAQVPTYNPYTGHTPVWLRPIPAPLKVHTSITLSATPGTFSTALPADPLRLDCTIYSAVAFAIDVGPSPSAATQIAQPAGAVFKCSSLGAGAYEQISVSSPTASAAVVVWAQ